MIRRPPRSTRTDTLFPYTTLFRSKLTVRVDEQPRVVQPLPFSKGKTAVEESSNLEVTEERNPMFEFKGGASLADIVKAVNAIGASPADLVAILEAMKQAGAMKAELVLRSEERRGGKACVSTCSTRCAAYY